MKRLNISVVIILTILGLLLTTSFYAKQTSLKTSPLSRKGQLIKVVGELEQKRERLKNDLKELRASLTEEEKRAASERGELTSFTKELQDLKTEAGFAAVNGPGIEVTLEDNPTVPSGEDPNNYIIHDYDLRAVINALWSGNAEAIAVNDQRLISTSAVRCVGTTILANFIRLGTPYVIKAAGNPDELEKSLNRDRHASLLLNSYAKSFGLRVKVTKVSGLKLPPYEGSLKVEYAKTVGEQ